MISAEAPSMENHVAKLRIHCSVKDTQNTKGQTTVSEETLQQVYTKDSQNSVKKNKVPIQTRHKNAQLKIQRIREIGQFTKRIDSRLIVLEEEKLKSTVLASGGLLSLLPQPTPQDNRAREPEVAGPNFMTNPLGDNDINLPVMAESS